MASPQQIQPQPAPASWEITEARAPDGTVFVVLVTHTVVGTQVLFLDPQAAKTLAAQLEQQASRAASGLIVPNPLLPPGSN